MFNLIEEKDKYLTACKSLKGLSNLTLKAYQIDLKQFCDFMRGRDCFDKNEINSYINMLHSLYKPKSAKRKIACIKAFYRYMEIEDINFRILEFDFNGKMEIEEMIIHVKRLYSK